MWSKDNYEEQKLQGSLKLTASSYLRENVSKFCYVGIMFGLLNETNFGNDLEPSVSVAFDMSYNMISFSVPMLMETSNQFDVKYILICRISTADCPEKCKVAIAPEVGRK